MPRQYAVERTGGTYGEYDILESSSSSTPPIFQPSDEDFFVTSPASSELEPPRPPFVEPSSPYSPPSFDNIQQSTPHSETHTPLESMERYELDMLTEDGRDFDRVIELLESNPLLLRTYYYFKHCTRTARRLEMEAEDQKTTAENLLGQLREMGIDEILREVVVKRRREGARLTRYGPANRVSSTSTTASFYTAPESIPRPNNPAPSTTTETTASPSVVVTLHIEPGNSPVTPIIIVESSDEDSNSSSSSRVTSRRQRRPNPITRVNRYQRRARTGLPFEDVSTDLESPV
jgi:hypothetical protein